MTSVVESMPSDSCTLTINIVQNIVGAHFIKLIVTDVIKLQIICLSFYKH